jgi:hypothetical protein
MASNAVSPYISRNPGDLITAGNWNQLQVEIKNDIAKQVSDGIASVKSVAHADDADKLGGQTPEELTTSILDQAKQILPARTGYWRSFNRLEVGEEKLLKHGLKAFPLVDLYQLDYFPAACATGGHEPTGMWVNLFLYHTSERTIRAVDTGNAAIKINVEPQGQTPFRMPFFDMLRVYSVEYNDKSSLDDLVNEFWSAFWGAPNDQFETDQYCQSPWFRKCCSDQRTVKDIKDRGDVDDLWFKILPRKTVNYAPAPAAEPPPAPTNIQVAHHDFDTTGITLLAKPVYSKAFIDNVEKLEKPQKFDSELKVMVLMKV